MVRGIDLYYYEKNQKGSVEVYLLPPPPRLPAVASLVAPPLVVCLATVQVVVVVLSPGNWVVKVVGWKWGWGSSGYKWVTFERVCHKRHTRERERNRQVLTSRSVTIVVPTVCMREVKSGSTPKAEQSKHGGKRGQCEEICDVAGRRGVR